jgi:cell division protein ZapA (FtsZ GTPase activity inhibitor)
VVKGREVPVKHLGLIGAILPLVVVAIALIGFVLTLRNDVTAAVGQTDAVQEELATIQGTMISDRAIRTDLHIESQQDLTDIANDLNERINELETNLAVANDQMKTIMGDHMGFADVLKELGESGALPSGERREYGGYGGK